MVFNPLEFPDSSVPSTYASPNHSGVHSVGSGADKSFDITSSGVSPASITVEIGSKTSFENNLSSTVSISFDSSNNTVQVSPGGEKTLAFNAITYFTARNDEGYKAQGRINVK